MPRTTTSLVAAAIGVAALTACSSGSAAPAPSGEPAASSAPAEATGSAAPEVEFLEPNSAHAGTFDDPIPVGETFKHPDYPWIVTIGSSDQDDAPYLLSDEVGYELLGIEGTLGFKVEDLQQHTIDEAYIDGYTSVAWQFVSGKELRFGTQHGLPAGTDAGDGAIYDYTTFHPSGCTVERPWSQLMYFSLTDEDGNPKDHWGYQETAQECVNVPADEVEGGLWRATLWDGPMSAILEDENYFMQPDTDWVYFATS